MEIKNSMEWVYQERGPKTESAIVRKYQKDCWDLLFPNMKPDKIIYELNTRWLPGNCHIILLETNTIEEVFRIMRDRMVNTDYDLKLIIKPDPRLKKVSEVY